MHATICDMVMDLVQNSIEANAKQIELKVEEINRHLKIAIVDDGKGMDAETLEKAKDPFWSDGKHRHRKVGLGLPFLYQTAEATGGTAKVDSTKGIGTTVEFEADASHLDLPEFGTFATAAATMMSYGFQGNLVIERSREARCYRITKAELTDALGDLNDAESLMLIRRFIEAQEEELGTL